MSDPEFGSKPGVNLETRQVLMDWLSPVDFNKWQMSYDDRREWQTSWRAVRVTPSADDLPPLYVEDRKTRGRLATDEGSQEFRIFFCDPFGLNEEGVYAGLILNWRLFLKYDGQPEPLRTSWLGSAKQYYEGEKNRMPKEVQKRIDPIVEEQIQALPGLNLNLKQRKFTDWFRMPTDSPRHERRWTAEEFRAIQQDRMYCERHRLDGLAVIELYHSIDTSVEEFRTSC